RLGDGAARSDGSNSGNAGSLRARNERRQGTGRGRLVTLTRWVVLGCGSYLPHRVLTNDELARKVDTSDEWIVQRTGIRERHIAAPGEVTSDMGLKAAQAALAAAGVEAGATGRLRLCPATPRQT